MKFANRGKPEVIVPAAALEVKNWHAVWSLHLAAVEVMRVNNISQAWIDRGHNWSRYNRVVRKLFVDAVLANKYDELVGEFTRRLLSR